MALQSFLPVAPDSHFSIQNLPYGVFSTRGGRRRVAVALGTNVIDLAALSQHGLFPGLHLQQATCFEQDTLNSFMSLGKSAWTEARKTITELFTHSDFSLEGNDDILSEVVIPMADVDLHMPVNIGDYTDFYASREHATNCGEILRGKGNELNDNWVHLPVAYHGRSSSIVISGTPVHRPWGQQRSANGKPECQPSSRMDFELEMAALIGTGNEMGNPISTADAGQHIFGLVLMNDWSARDTQKWEAAPLGPFTAKNFATSISPWVVTMDALEPFRCEAPVQEPAVLDYLQESNRGTYDVALEVALQPEGCSQPTTITQSNLKHMYWTLEQMVAHHTLGGCNLRPGDLLGTGTISCNAPNGFGSLLEASWAGTRAVQLSTGQQRTFLEDGDTVILSGYCQGDGFRVGFGECKGTLLPCRQPE